MRTKLFILPLLLVLTLTGCTVTKQSFVAVRDVPSNPTIAVVPANSRLYQAHFANSVENLVLAAGLNVIERPSIAETSISKSAQKAEASDADLQAAGMSAEIVQTYHGYQESEADYIIETFALSRQVRILKQQDSEILASFFIPSVPIKGTRGERELDSQSLHEALRIVGLPVRNMEQ